MSLFLKALASKAEAPATRRALGLVLTLALAACSREPTEPAPAPAQSAGPAALAEGAGWLLSGTSDERFARVAKHLRGFDVAMVEIGYRYGELYRAGQDDNWEYAKYQVDKIRTALKNGVERRPKRGPSAQILDPALRRLEEAMVARDPALFNERFTALTATCNECHRVEEVPFVRVRPPVVRAAPAGPSPVDGGVD